MTPVHFKSLIAFKTKDGDNIAFHSERLELAKISDAAMRLLQTKQNSDLNNMPDQSDESALTELIKWDQLTSDDTETLPIENTDSHTLKNNTNKYNQNTKYKINKLVINNTQICNLKCIYCAAGGDGTYGDPVVKISVAKTLPQIKFIVDRLSDGDILRINFMGGEPLLEPLIIKSIYDYAKELTSTQNMSLQVVVTTNGTVITDEVVSTLVHMRAAVNISLDAPAEVNDLLRPQKNKSGSTHLVLEGLKKLLEKKSQLNGVGVTSVFCNLYTDVVKTYNFLKNLDVDWYEFNFSHTETSTEASLKFSESLAKTAALAWDLGQEKELCKIRAFQHFFKKLDLQQKTKSFCGIGKSLLILDARNQAFACPWHVGQKDKQLSELEFKDDSILKKVMPVDHNDCEKCWAKNLCGGGCDFIHSVHPNKIDKNFCNRIQNLITDTFMYYEKSRRQ